MEPFGEHPDRLTLFIRVKKTLKSRNGSTLGFLWDISVYKKAILNPSGAMLGWYDETLDKTFNGSGAFVGYGDLRASLLHTSR